MTTPTLYALASVIAVSGVSFVGIVVISFSEERLRRMLSILVSLAAGGLFGDAFLHLLPEAFRRPETITTKTIKRRYRFAIHYI